MAETAIVNHKKKSASRYKNEEDWFVVRTIPRHEKKVAERLESLGYTVWLPIYTTIRLWSDRKKKVSVPLISSTLFVRNLNVDKKALYTVPGFRSILKINNEIGRVRQEEIDRLKLVVDEGMELEETDILSFLPGDEVEIMGGPLIGHRGKAIEELSAYRVLIDIPLLELGYSVSIAKNKVQKLS